MPTFGSQTRSKRSKRVRLTTMVALGSGAMLTACGSEPAAEAPPLAESDKHEVEVFENVFACAKATGKTREECDSMREEAAQRAAEEAPRFASLEDCEAEYGAGQCVSDAADTGEEQTRRRSHFSPFIVAWFSSSRNGNAPLFKSPNGGYQTANGARLGYGGAPGKYVTSSRAFERAKSVPKVKPASKMAKAGGFGSRSGSWALADRNGGSSKSKSSGSSLRSRGG